MPRLATFRETLAPFCFLVVIFSVALPRQAAAQMVMSDPTMGTVDQTPPDQLPAPQKMTGIGNVSMHITASPEAQMWFNQGLNLIHDFWDYESARAYEQSVRVDPQCAICYWGLYKAESFSHSTEPGYAGEALAQAVKLERHASKYERLLIGSSDAFEETLKHMRPGAPPDFSKEMTFLRELVKDYPKDTQARIFLAQAVEDGFDSKGEPRPGQQEAIKLFESVLKDDPQNSAANHYYIHALEPSAHPEKALRSAELLASLAPASGHMVHMPGHIFFRMGDYAQAEKAFSESLQVDEHYMQSQHVQPDYDWNYVHNIMYAVTNLMEEGKLNEATALSSKLTQARGQMEPTFYIYRPRDSISRVDARMPVALRTADWELVLQLSKGSTLPTTQPNLRFLAGQLADFATGMLAFESGDLDAAQESSARFDAQMWRMSQQAPNTGMQMMVATNSPATTPKIRLEPDALLQPILSTLSIMSLELRGSLLVAQKQTTEAQRVFAEATQREKTLGYQEPPAYIRPVGEAEAAAFMTIGDWADAKTSFEAALAERPRSGFPLYGIALCSEQAGDTAAAAKEYDDFLAAWNNADPSLDKLGHARNYVADHLKIASTFASVE